MSATSARLTPIHTDFGNTQNDLLVVEYDVPQTNVIKTLFYKYGQMSIPKWALIPAAILFLGVLAALLAIILNAILSQPLSDVTYSQACSKTSRCQSSRGLICGSESKCTCPTNEYWYQASCVNQPTYLEKCNQTKECRTDLGLICSQIDGICTCPHWTKSQTCDRPKDSFWTGSKCQARSSYLGLCNIVDISYQCLSNLYCNGTRCICQPDTQYWNGTSSSCFEIDTYRAACNPATKESCRANVSLECLPVGTGSQCPLNATAASYTCDCVNGTYWNGGSCVPTKTSNSSCFWNCECDMSIGLRCLNNSCVCPQTKYWLDGICGKQLNYTHMNCTNNRQCDETQGLICYRSGSACNCPQNSLIGMCDCSPGQFYDTNMTSCQSLRLYNETCYSNYMCDLSLGLFCQTNLFNATNCSCPEPVRQYMCDCNATSYWNGVSCVSRLSANVSCSLSYQCETPLICIANETDNGIFSDVCRCSLGSYYVSGGGCVPSQNYLDTCVGSYQCDERIPLMCRYNATFTTCLFPTGQTLPRCDCLDGYYYETSNNTCILQREREESCSTSCQCQPPFICQNSICVCPYFYSSLDRACVQNLRYNDSCLSNDQCANATYSNLICVNGFCGCNSYDLWNGTHCATSTNFRSICTSNGGCLGGLICRSMPCMGSNSRCSCPDQQYFYSVNQTCLPCISSGGITRTVIRYLTREVCIAVINPNVTLNLTFSSANIDCSNSFIPSMGPNNITRLLSIRNKSEINCLAYSLRTELVLPTCKPSSNLNVQYYLGYDTSTRRFYDGTFGSDIDSSLLTSPATNCLTFCSIDNRNGKLALTTCSGTTRTSGETYRTGAFCDLVDT